MDRKLKLSLEREDGTLFQFHNLNQSENKKFVICDTFLLLNHVDSKMWVDVSSKQDLLSEAEKSQKLLT
jgi:chromatin remodeling complex protein RSC6